MANDDGFSSNLIKITIELEPHSLHACATERLWADQLDRGVFRLRNSPFYAYGLSFGDIVLAVEGELGWTFVQVVKHSGHSTYRIIVRQPLQFKVFWEPLQSLGCTFEEGHAHLLAVDVPPNADIHAVYKLLALGEQANVWHFEEGHCAQAIA